MTNIPPPTEGFVESLTRVARANQQRWVDDSGKRIYTWDRLHGEFEVFNARGHHLGAVDVSGKFVKPPVKGRRIDV